MAAVLRQAAQLGRRLGDEARGEVVARSAIVRSTMSANSTISSRPSASVAVAIGHLAERARAHVGSEKRWNRPTSPRVRNEPRQVAKIQLVKRGACRHRQGPIITRSFATPRSIAGNAATLRMARYPSSSGESSGMITRK
jgi:hypothetical protein